MAAIFLGLNVLMHGGGITSRMNMSVYMRIRHFVSANKEMSTSITFDIYATHTPWFYFNRVCIINYIP